MAITRIVNNWNSLTTSSAPNLSGTAGALIGVLDFCLVTTLGWTKPYSGTNLAVYKQPAGTNEMYLWVDDTNAQNSRVRGYEVMSDVSVGYNPFISEVQLAGGSYYYKSSAADSSARGWYFISNGKIFYLVSNHAGVVGATTVASAGLIFGDLVSTRRGVADIYNTVCVANVAASSTGSSSYWAQMSAGWSVTGGHYVARAHTGLGGSLQFATLLDTTQTGGGTGDLGGSGLTLPFPSTMQGGMVISRVWQAEATYGIRGFFPGLWAPGHNKPFTNQFETFTGAAGTMLAGKTFEVVHAPNTGQVFFETSDTWDTE